MSTVLPSTSNDQERAQTLGTFAGSGSQRRRRSRVCGVLACLLLTGSARAGPASRRGTGIVTGFVGRAPSTTTRFCSDSETEHASALSLRRMEDAWSRKGYTRRRGVASMAVTTSAAGLQAETAAQQSR